MSDSLPEGWKSEPLRNVTQVVSGGTPSRYIPEFWDNGKIPWVTPTDITSSKGRLLSDTREHITERGLQSCSARLLPAGTLLMTSRATLGEVRISACEVCTNQGFKSLIPFSGVDNRFLYYQIALNKERYKGLGIGSTFLEVNKRDTEKFEILIAPESQQRRIAEILSTLDETIEQTEVLIAKMQQIKAGLMHDLFTRGVTPDGRLRPTCEQAPDLYKKSSLGWIPKEWETSPIAAIAESLVDGPFGSNLKSEHYVVEPGVRIVRLQNIQEGYYDDSDPVFVSQHHADYLSRNAVNPGDVLIAALGDENYPVGRSCCYPADLPPAINKADCFRLRCLSDMVINTYMMHFLNTAAARCQIKRYEQGVTRRRTNLGNLRRIIVTLPNIDEQHRIIQRLASVSTQVETGDLQVAKLRQQKHGLMNDLLTGRVHVKEAC